MLLNSQAEPLHLDVVDLGVDLSGPVGSQELGPNVVGVTQIWPRSVDR